MYLSYPFPCDGPLGVLLLDAMTWAAVDIGDQMHSFRGGEGVELSGHKIGTRVALADAAQRHSTVAVPIRTHSQVSSRLPQHLVWLLF